MSSGFNIYTRGMDRRTTGMLSNWTSLSLVIRRNGVSKWTITVPYTEDVKLLGPGSGVIITREDGTVLLSGWRWPEYQITTRGSQSELILSGWDDTVMMEDTLCWPRPQSPISGQIDKDHIVTGRASTRIRTYFNSNVIGRLAIPGATLDTDPVAGRIGKSRVRFTQLLEHAKDIAALDLNFRVVQDPSGTDLVLKVWEPLDQRLSVQFSPHIGTVTEWMMSDSGPSATRAIIGCGDEAEGRLFLRVTNDGGLLVPGVSGDYASTPNHSSLQITGDIELRADVTTDQWQDSSVGFKYLVAKYGIASNKRSYALRISSGGRLNLAFSTDGSNAFSRSATEDLPIVSGRLAVKITFDVNDGSGNHVVRFYYSDDIDAPDEDWTQLGDPVTTAGTITMHSNDSVLEAGTSDTGGSINFVGTIHAAQIRNGINGTVVANPRFSAQKSGQTSFTDSTGKSWTVNGNAVVHQELIGSREIDWDGVRKIERFLDARDLDPIEPTTIPEGGSRGDEFLVQERRGQSLLVTTIDTPGQQYGIDYDIGDLVRVAPFPDQFFDDLIEQVTLEWDAENGEVTSAWIGPVDEPEERDAKRERKMRARLRRLESGL